MGDFTENLLESMKIISQAANRQADANTTINASIIGIVDESLRQYSVKYELATFTATAISSTDVYNKGDLVSILIPNGDMSARGKRILGHVGSNILNRISGTSIIDQYQVISSGCFSTGLISQLRSYHNETQIIYEMGETDTSIKSFLSNANEGHAIKVSVNIRTAIPEEQRTAFGSYGLNIYLKYKNSKGLEFTEKKTFSSTGMSGNALLYTTPITQSFFIDLSKDMELVGVSKLEIFSNFALQDEKKPADIWMRDINIYAAQLTKEDTTDLYVSPTDFDLSGDVAEQLVAASFKINNKNAETMTSGAQYYWFKEDIRVTNISSTYSTHGGVGWRCLNEPSASMTNSFIATGNTFYIKKEECISEQTAFKCVGIYGGEAYQREFVVINSDSDYSVELVSVAEGSIIQGATPTIICEAYLEDELLLKDDLTYLWKAFDSSGVAFTELDNPLSVVKDRAIVDTRNFVDYITVRCTVLNKSKEIIGTGSKIVSIATSESDRAYDLRITNSDRIFNFNTDGSLNAATAEILPLSFELINNETGARVANLDELIASNLIKVSWYIPKENSMIDISNNDNQSELDSSSDDYYILKNSLYLDYGINEPYSINKDNNTIRLTVLYQGNSYQATADITCIGTGEGGSNGTNYFLTYFPKFGNPLEQAELARYTYKTDEISTDNYGGQLTGKVYFNGVYQEDIFTSEQYCENSDFIKIGMDDRKNGAKLSTIIPIAHFEIETTSAKDYTFYWKKGTGFNKVMYNSQGSNPIYRKDRPFELIVLDSKNNYITDDFSFHWGIYSEDRDGFSQNLTLIEENGNTATIIPVQLYLDTQLINKKDRVVCEISYKDTLYATVTIPVYMYYNAYSIDAVNAYDGQSAGSFTDSEGRTTTVASPLLIGGAKDSQNRFSGVLMGQVTEEGSTSRGLFGYFQGEQTFLLDSNNGNLRLGKLSGNYIDFNPSSNKKEDFIHLMNDSFTVNGNGYMYAKEAQFAGTKVNDISCVINQGGEINIGKISSEEEDLVNTSRYAIYTGSNSKTTFSEYQRDIEIIKIVDDSEETEKIINSSYYTFDNDTNTLCFVSEPNDDLIIGNSYRIDYKYKKTKGIISNPTTTINESGIRTRSLGIDRFNSFSKSGLVITHNVPCSGRITINSNGTIGVNELEKTINIRDYGYNDGYNYHPIGIIGYDFDGMSRNCSVFAVKLREKKRNSAKICCQMTINSTTQSSVDVTGYFDILWIRVE